MMDSAFLDDKLQLSNTLNLALGPAVYVLKNAASFVAAIMDASNGVSSVNSWELGHFGSNNKSAVVLGIVEKAVKQEAETNFALHACESAANINLQVGQSEWCMERKCESPAKFCTSSKTSSVKI